MSAEKLVEAQPVNYHLGACITDGKFYATVMRREADKTITVVATAEIDAARLYDHDCIASMTQATPSAQAEPSVMVPLSVLVDASQALGNFVGDLGWDADDMQAMDNLDAYIAPHYTETQAEPPQVEGSVAFQYCRELVANQMAAFESALGKQAEQGGK